MLKPPSLVGSLLAGMATPRTGQLRGRALAKLFYEIKILIKIFVVACCLMSI